MSFFKFLLDALSPLIILVVIIWGYIDGVFSAETFSIMILLLLIWTKD